MCFDMSPGVLHAAPVFESDSANEPMMFEYKVEAEVHKEMILCCLDSEWIDSNKDKMGAPMGVHVTNLANGEKSLTRTLDHASVLHGIGVATVAFVGD